MASSCPAFQCFNMLERLLRLCVVLVSVFARNSDGVRQCRVQTSTLLNVYRVTIITIIEN